MTCRVRNLQVRGTDAAIAQGMMAALFVVLGLIAVELFSANPVHLGR